MRIRPCLLGTKSLIVVTVRVVERDGAVGLASRKRESAAA